MSGEVIDNSRPPVIDRRYKSSFETNSFMALLREQREERVARTCRPGASLWDRAWDLQVRGSFETSNEPET